MRRYCSFITIVGAAVLVTSTLWAQAADPFAGTWKLNVAKSIFELSPPFKSRTMTFEVIENGYNTVQDWVTADGQNRHSEGLAKFDGKEYPLTGAAAGMSRAFTRIDARSYEQVTRVSGKVTQIVRVVVSPDGKTRTSTETQPGNAHLRNVLVYDKQ